MREAVTVMDEFPMDSVPPDMAMPERESSGSDQWSRAPSIEGILSDPQVQAWLQEIIDSWPKNLMPVFLQASGILGQVLEMFGARGDGGMTDILAAGMTDPETIQMMSALAQIDREMTEHEKDKDDEQKFDPMGMQEALLTELRRRGTAHRSPFARTVTTLLGQDALLWLTADSQDGHGKIQPHEFTRTGWHRIWSIDNQLTIEQELLEVPPEAQHLGKIVVSLSWTLSGLASFIPPVIFFGEGLPYLSSTREGGYTVSVGRATHTLVAFELPAMRSLVRILAEGLTNPLLSAADLMWIGAGLARIREIQSGFGEALPSVQERFTLFLSHRGRDAKRALAEVVQEMPVAHGVLLDCMVLPRGVV